jgi:hypothetical protein
MFFRDHILKLKIVESKFIDFPQLI